MESLSKQNVFSTDLEEVLFEPFLNKRSIIAMWSRLLRACMSRYIIAYIFDPLLKHTFLIAINQSISMDKKIFRLQQVEWFRREGNVKIEHRIIEIRTWTTIKDGYEADSEGGTRNSFIKKRILKSSERIYNASNI